MRLSAGISGLCLRPAVATAYFNGKTRCAGPGRNRCKQSVAKRAVKSGAKTMSKRISKISPAANKSMATPLKAQPAASTRPNTKSGAKKSRTARSSLSKPEFSSTAIKKSLSLLFPFSIFLLLGLSLIWERVKVGELAVQISKLESQRMQLGDQNDKLCVQLEQLSGYGRISRLATQRLGLVAVPQQAILVAED